MTTLFKVKCRLFPLLAVCALLFPCSAGAESQKALSVHGAVEKSLSLTLEEIEAMPEFHINYIAELKEKQSPDNKEELIEVADYEGVLLRDILEKAGMKYKRKFEPGVYFRVRGPGNEGVVFSFGEIIYSSIGRSALLAYRKNGKSIGSLSLVVSNDIRNGRRISDVSEIVVERVDIEMKVYEENKKNIVQPPTTELMLLDKQSGKSVTIVLKDLMDLPKIEILDKVQIGDCEGFHGVHSYEGATLRSLLEKGGFVSRPYRYDRYVAITSKNGFSATYSMGELFNSKLGNNIIIAYKKDGQMLGDEEAFAMMAAGEDSTGGRSVKRISDIYIY